METLDKKIRRFTRTEERSVAKHFKLLKTWSILRMLKGTNCWQFFDFLDFFLFFSNSKVKVLSKFCILFVIYFPEIHLWVSLYFWRVTHKYKLARRVDLAKNFEVLIFFFFFAITNFSLFWTLYPVPCNFEKVGVDCSYVLTKHCLNILNKGYKKISCFSSTFW